MFFQPISYKRADITITVRLTEAIYGKLLQTKAEVGTSLNSLILQCCEWALKEARPEREEGPL